MDGIHDGYITFFLLLLIFILLATGWNRLLADGLTLGQAALFAAGLLALQPLETVVKGGLTVHGSVLWSLAASMAVMRVRRLNPGYVLVSSVLLGMLWVWVDALYRSDPLLEIVDPRLDVPMLCGCLTALLVLQAGQQFAVVTLASAVRAVLSAGLLPGGDIPDPGSWHWWDGYFTALASARLTAIAFRSAAALATVLLNKREGGV